MGLQPLGSSSSSSSSSKRRRRRRRRRKVTVSSGCNSLKHPSLLYGSILPLMAIFKNVLQIDKGLPYLRE